MALPWLQIVQLVPSILDVSRDLLRKTRQTPEPANNGPTEDVTVLTARLARLEENERRQAELINKMAEQLAVLAQALTLMQRRGTWLMLIAAGSTTLAIIALIVAIRIQ